MPADTSFLFKMQIVQDSSFFFFDVFASELKFLKTILY